MAKLVWDLVGERFFETGVSQGVLYPVDSNGNYADGVAWNGLVGVTESPSGAEASPFYADNIKYLSLISVEEFGGTIEAFTYPDEFGQCDGSAALAAGVNIGQQARKMFGLVYVTKLGNDVDDSDHGEKIHIIYGAKAAPSERAYQTINDSPEAITFSWEFSTTPVAVEGHKPTAILTIDSTKITDPADLTTIKDSLFGATATPATLLLPSEILAIINA